MIVRGLAVLLAVALALPGCAAAGIPRLQTAAADRTRTERTLLADYVQKLPAGTRVRVHLRDGRRERGTLMDANAERIVIQPRARIPEPPLELPLDRVAAVDIETPGVGVGRAIGIGIAAGAGVILGLILVLSAIYSD